jgi:Putative restriction endonuclease
MGHAAEKHRRATYADMAAVPPEKVAELVDGELYVFPRPAPRHLESAGALFEDLRGPFHRGRGGPGGWWILMEPEVHFPDPAAPRGLQAVVPDIAGWRRERMPEIPDTAFFALAPNWICEVLSPSTRMHDRDRKMPLYARHGVRWAWLVDPAERVLEVFALDDSGRWGEPRIYQGAARVRAVPFDAVELDLALLWAR